MASHEDHEMTSGDDDIVKVERHSDDSRKVSIAEYLDKLTERVVQATEDQLSQSHAALRKFFAENREQLSDKTRDLLSSESGRAEEERNKSVSDYRSSRKTVPAFTNMKRWLSAKVERLEKENLQLQARKDLSESGVSEDEQSMSGLVAHLREKEKIQEELELRSASFVSKMQADLTANERQLNELTVSTNSRITYLENELRVKSNVIQDQENQIITLIAQQKHNLSMKAQEIRRLHAYILQGGQERDPYDDDYLSKKFTALEAEIAHLVKKHFPGVHGHTGWKEYDSVKAPDDRDFFLQALLATEISLEYFSHDAQLFGLDEANELRQGTFERMLQKRTVPESEIVKWRVQTIRVAERVASESSDYRIIQLRQELSKQLKVVHKHVSQPEKWHDAQGAINAMCKSAFDLALSLRNCGTVYEWSQTGSPSSLNETHIERIEEYNVGGKVPLGRPAKILFGPVYKRVDGTPVLLRNGTVLYD